jgi:MerR family transcriptional regulator, mercuric resistance operon regulatory protein
MNKLPPPLTIGTFAAEASVSVETVRYYQRRGLLAEPERPGGGIRRYGSADVARVKFIKAAQHLGFSLDEVSALLRLEDGTHCGEARALGQHKLDDVRERLAALRRIELVLAKLVRECGGARGTVSCPLIAAMQTRSFTSPAQSG